jgi:hypothetical protein
MEDDPEAPPPHTAFDSPTASLSIPPVNAEPDITHSGNFDDAPVVNAVNLPSGSSSGDDGSFLAGRLTAEQLMEWRDGFGAEQQSRGGGGRGGRGRGRGGRGSATAAGQAGRGCRAGRGGRGNASAARVVAEPQVHIFSFTGTMNGGDITVADLRRVEEFLLSRSARFSVSIELQPQAGNLHLQGIIRVTCVSATKFGKELKAFLGWGAMHKVCMRTLNYGVRLHTWIGMIGYCHKVP